MFKYRSHDQRIMQVAAIAGAGAVAGGVISAYGATSAADTQASADNNATAAQLQMFNTTQNETAPYRQAGYTALNQLGAGTADGGQFNHSFNASDLNSNLAPNYQFQLNQGMGALTNQLTTQGGAVSGNALQGLESYAQNYASNAYQNAFNNYQTDQSNIFNRLSTIAGLGNAATSTSANSANSTGSGVASTTAASGAAQAAGITGASNSLSGALNNASSWYAGYSPSSSNSGTTIYGNAYDSLPMSAAFNS